MGTLTCNRCGATAEGEDFGEADASIDHSLGLKIGRPCSGKESDLVYDGSYKTTIDESESPRKKPKRGD